MADKVLFEWRKPHKVTKREVVSYIKEHRFAPLNITFITALLIWPVYLAFIPILPESESGLSWEIRFLLFVLGAFLVSCVIIYVGPYIEFLSPTGYNITDKLLKVITSQPKSYRISDITGYFIENNKDFEDVINILIYHRKRKRPISLFIENNDDSRQIISFFTEHFSELHPDEATFNAITPTRAQHYYLFISSYILSVVAAYYTYDYLKKDWIQIIGLIWLFAGPGTIAIILLFRNLVWKNKHLFVYGYVYNMLSSMIYFLFAACFKIQNLIRETGTL